MSTLPFRMVDAFAERIADGNSAGVVIGADQLSDAQMQRIAREVNASETAFVSRLTGTDHPTLRWFTPTCEVDFCGHATLGAAHGLLEAEHASIDKGVVFESKAGILRVEVEPLAAGNAILWLQMPTPELAPLRGNAQKLLNALGLTFDDLDPRLPIVVTRDRDGLLALGTWQRLQEMTPNMTQLLKVCQELKLRGVGVLTTQSVTASVHVTTRFFAPAFGVPEDPVTGSLHGPVAMYLRTHVPDRVPTVDGLAALNGYQGIPGDRGGLVRMLVSSNSEGAPVYKIGGCCRTSIRGEFQVPT